MYLHICGILDDSLLSIKQSHTDKVMPATTGAGTEYAGKSDLETRDG